MALSNSTKVLILDPTIHNNQRCEFRIPDGALANLMLCDLGVYSANAVNRATGVFYPSLLGVMAAVKSLSLFSGAVMLDQIQELPAYATVQHLKVSNQAMEDLARFELLNGASWSVKADDGPLNALNLQGTLSNEVSHKDYVQRYNESAGVFKQFLNNQIQVANAEAGQPSGMVSLATYLKFLQTVPILNHIPDLRLIIEWNTNAADYNVDADAPSAVTPAFVPIRPQLVVTEILGLPMPAPAEVQKIPFQSTIVERFVVAAAADGVTKNQSFRSQAFKNRFVKDLLFFNKASVAEGYITAKERSIAQKNETIQLVINQRKFLPDVGINQEAMKLRYFSDTFGGLNIPLTAAMSHVQDYTNGTYRFADPQGAVWSHNMSVGGCVVNQVIDRLDVEVSRVGSVAQTNQTDQYELLVFGTVNRLLEVQGENIRLSY